MRGLNKIFKDIDKVRQSYLELLPSYKTQINVIFNSLQQIFETINYEKKKGNTKRYWFTKKDFPVNSIIEIIYKLLSQINNPSIKAKESALGELEAMLQLVQWDIQKARRNINKMLSKE